MHFFPLLITPGVPPAARRASPRMLSLYPVTHLPPMRSTVPVRLPVHIRCCALPEDDVDISAAREALERALLLEDASGASSDRLQEPGTSNDRSQEPSTRIQEPSTRIQASGQPSGEFRFQEPSASGPPIDDVALGLAEVQDLGERVGGLAWLGLTFWVNLPGMQYFVLGAFLLFGALCSTGEFGGRFVASAPPADEGAYYGSYRRAPTTWVNEGVTDESGYVLDGLRGSEEGQ